MHLKPDRLELKYCVLVRMSVGTSLCFQTEMIELKQMARKGLPTYIRTRRHTAVYALYHSFLLRLIPPASTAQRSSANDVCGQQKLKKVGVLIIFSSTSASKHTLDSPGSAQTLLKTSILVNKTPGASGVNM